MRIPRIHHPDNLQVGQEVVLAEQASIHVLRVLRLKVGSNVMLFNGEGGEYLAQLQAIRNKSAVVLITQHNEKSTESPLKIHLGQGISRSERMDYVIQKATELGVGQITPLRTEHCGVKLSAERIQKRLAHWRQVSISACEQSGRCQIPQINEPQPLSDWLRTVEGLCLLCDPQAKKGFFTLTPVANHATLLIGPEGGLSEAEIDLAQENNFQAISLGPRVLRTETAAVVALALMQSAWGDIPTT